MNVCMCVYCNIRVWKGILYICSMIRAIRLIFNPEIESLCVWILIQVRMKLSGVLHLIISPLIITSISHASKPIPSDPCSLSFAKKPRLHGGCRSKVLPHQCAVWWRSVIRDGCVALYALKGGSWWATPSIISCTSPRQSGTSVMRVRMRMRSIWIDHGLTDT